MVSVSTAPLGLALRTGKTFLSCWRVIFVFVFSFWGEWFVGNFSELLLGLCDLIVKCFERGIIGET